MKINLVALPTSSIGFKQGGVVLTPPVTPKGQTPTPTTSTSDLLLQVILTGVVEGGSPVTSTGNHLVVNGQLALAVGQSQPIAIDQEFTISNGAATVQVPVLLPNFKGSGALEIDSVALSDANGQIFAVAGVMVHKKAHPTKTPKPHHSPKPKPTLTPTPKA